MEIAIHERNVRPMPDAKRCVAVVCKPDNAEKGAQPMPFLKKEWRTVAVAVWLVLITVFLIRISGQMGRLEAKNAKMASTLDTVESVAISTDAAVAQTAKKVGEMEGNVNFITDKLRRR
ncbi:MAG: hypothetical protein HZB87_05770 [Desulfatitalea sp.]|nr:hypothetical protein [Desulfatitalea sp.]MBI5896749.1 hypothetical protein [Desulfobacterales bacterium]